MRLLRAAGAVAKRPHIRSAGLQALVDPNEATVIQLDPGYCYAYHQKGLAHENTGDTDAARQAYREGISAATRKGDLHAKGEIEAALEMLG